MKTAGAAVVVFVKTPGLSPIKTRLAEGLGRARADEFYRLSLAAVEASVAAVSSSTSACPYWAVAEEEAMPHLRWQQFATVWQGEGGLGDRLSHVFSELRRRHTAIIAIGGDSPQITPQLLVEAVDCLSADPSTPAHVLGRCYDGGFYLFGANRDLPADTWRDVPYGTQDAAERLTENLAGHGEIVELPQLTDVDRSDDLAVIVHELRAVANPSPEQRAIANWAKRRVGTVEE